MKVDPYHTLLAAVDQYRDEARRCEALGDMGESQSNELMANFCLQMAEMYSTFKSAAFVD